MANEHSMEEQAQTPGGGSRPAEVREEDLVWRTDESPIAATLAGGESDVDPRVMPKEAVPSADLPESNASDKIDAVSASRAWGGRAPFVVALKPRMGWVSAASNTYTMTAMASARPRRWSVRTVVTSGMALIVMVGLLLFSLGGLTKAAALSGLPFFHIAPKPALISASKSVAKAAATVHTAPKSASSATAAPTAGAQAPTEYPIGALSPTLSTYLQGIGPTVGVSVYDVTRNRWYSFNDQQEFLMGSSAKIPIMLEYFQNIESQGQSPSPDDQALLTTMIENSDNDAAQDFYSAFGYDAGLSNYLVNTAGLEDFTTSPDGFGWTTMAPRGMVRLLTTFYQGNLTNSADRALGLSLMENIESDQQQGVGDTAPSGATVAMKDGWVQGPDGAWAANSSGIVTVHGETYIIAVYTQEFDSLGDAYDVLDHVCDSIGQSLNPAVASAISG